jgi:hypothetical protein
MRRPLCVLLVVCGCLAAAGVALSSSSRHPAIHIAVARAAGPACGVEAWAVKTLSDPAAIRVDLRPRPSTVAALTRLREPASIETRLPGAEMHVWRVRVRLVAEKLEADSDVHLEVEDARGRTMVAEIPAPRCVGAAAARRQQMGAARVALRRYCGVAETRYRRLRGTATIDGVAFFDRVHGQRGAAPNGIELHPVLRLIPGRARC